MSKGQGHSRRFFLKQGALFVCAGVVLKHLGGCGNEWTFMLDESSTPATVLELTEQYYGPGNIGVHYDRELGREVRDIPGYRPDRSEGEGWKFRVDDVLFSGNAINAESVIVYPGSTVEWVVATPA